MSERGKTIFHHSVETPLVSDPKLENKKNKKSKISNIPIGQIKGIEVDYIDITRRGGKHPISSDEPEVDFIDIVRHKNSKEQK